MCSPFSNLLGTSLQEETGRKFHHFRQLSRCCYSSTSTSSQISHRQLCIGSVRQLVHKAGTCLGQTLQSLAPVGSLGQETLLHSLLLPLHLLQEALLFFLQGFTCCTDLSQHLLPLPVRRYLYQKRNQEVIYVIIKTAGK